MTHLFDQTGISLCNAEVGDAFSTTGVDCPLCLFAAAQQLDDAMARIRERKRDALRLQRQW